MRRIAISRKITMFVATACVSVVGSIFLLASSRAEALGRPTYPQVLHGFWIPADDSCPPNGQSYDGDQMMDVANDRLTGYEEVSKPVKVSQVSRTPRAWRIESLIDVGPSGIFEKAPPQLFLLGESTLTVASEEATYIFKRCEIAD